ncbi:MAG: hypothetical protein M3O41_03405 [Pseudomonadota bacterium]|nr:hypothetical protein [Pseudomonadota bacterium]
MTVLFPSKKIALRWNGALEARLRRAPLESFLQTRGLKCALSGPSQITDNLASAIIFLVDKGITAYGTDRGPFPAARYAVVGQIACAVSRGLAALVLEPASWRIAGLVGTARLLAPFTGLDAAAHLAAAAARDYSRTLGTCAQDIQLLQVSHAASAAVESNDETLTAGAQSVILQCLSSMPCRIPAEKSKRAAALSYDVGGATFKSLTT